MPIEVGELINHFSDSFLKAPIVHTIVKNPIYTSLMITFSIMIIILIIFRDADTEESLLIMALRSGFWIFLMLIGVLFLHNKVLSNETELETKNAAYEDVFATTYGGSSVPGKISPAVFEDTIVPVNINTNFTI